MVSLIFKLLVVSFKKDGANETFGESENSALDEIEDLEQFVFHPAPQNVAMKCRITRDKKGIDRGIFPTYYLHLERDDGRKVTKLKILNFVINV